MEALPATFVLVARGTSMNRAGIQDGDPLCITRARKARHGDVVVAQVGAEGITAKRLRVGARGAWLVPESDDSRHEPILVDDTVEFVGVVEGKQHPELGLVPLERPLELDALPLMRGRELVGRPRFVPLTSRAAQIPAEPRFRPAQKLAQWPRVDEHMGWLTYAGQVGCYEAIDPTSAKLAWVPAFYASISDFVVMAADNSMVARGIREGDLVFVKQFAVHRILTGLVVVADLGDQGAVFGELRRRGSKLSVGSSQGIAFKYEMNQVIREADVLGLAFLVGR